jgi:hypothetical protein
MWSRRLLRDRGLFLSKGFVTVKTLNCKKSVSAETISFTPCSRIRAAVKAGNNALQHYDGAVRFGQDGDFLKCVCGF